MQTVIRPRVLYIEANASCQLRCPTCPTTSNGYPPVVGSGYLKAASVKKLLDENPRISRIEFENRGEMFLNPELLQILHLCFEREVAMACNSGVNLNNVGKGVLEGLAQYNFQRLLCSIDGASSETYRMYRVGGDFDTVIRHIHEINYYKQHYKTSYPELIWQFVVFGHNEHELPLAKEMAEQLQMKFVPKMSWDSEYSPIRNPEFVMEQTGWPAISREEYQQTTGKEYMRNVCFALWHSPRVNWDGKILGCCWNSWGDFGGNAFQNGYIAALNNPKINYARRLLLGKEKAEDSIPCVTCSLYQTMRETGRYLTIREISESNSRWYRGARYVYHRIPGARYVRRLLKGQK